MPSRSLNSFLMRLKSTTPFFSFLLLLCAILLLIKHTSVAESKTLLYSFQNKGFHYGYAEWKKIKEIQTLGEKAVHLNGPAKGGSGLIFKDGLDASGSTGLLLRIKKGDQNTSKNLHLKVMMQDGSSMLKISSDQLSSSEFTDIPFSYNAGKVKGSLDPSQITGIQLQGSFSSSQIVDIFVESIHSFSSADSSNPQEKTTSADSKTPSKTKDSNKDLFTSGPPPKAKPWEPGWGFYSKHPKAWIGQHKRNLKRTKQKNIDILFYGDSLTHGWRNKGKEIWKKRYAPLNAVNYGIGGDSTRQILWRIEQGEIEGLDPKLIVLMIGTNNLYKDHNSGSNKEIAKGIKTVVETLRQKLPQTKILLLGLLPRQNDWFSKRVREINTIISTLDDGTNIRYLDMGEHYVEEPGKVIKSLYHPDKLHLDTKGYDLWAKTMDPLFQEMIK